MEGFMVDFWCNECRGTGEVYIGEKRKKCNICDGRGTQMDMISIDEVIRFKKQLDEMDESERS